MKLMNEMSQYDLNCSGSKSSVKQGPSEAFDSRLNVMASINNPASANDFQ